MYNISMSGFSNLFLKKNKRSPKPTSSSVLNSLPFSWDSEKNENLDPNTLSIGSGKEAYWKCPNGHSFKRTIQAAASLQECPVCRSYKSSEIIKKELLDEWDYEKNKDISPDEDGIMLSTGIWWKCRICQKSWYAILNSRINMRTGCPYCNRKSPNKHVYQYDTSYNFIKEWSSIVAATKAVHARHGYIKEVCEGKRYKAGGYFWTYADGSEEITNEK